MKLLLVLVLNAFVCAMPLSQDLPVTSKADNVPIVEHLNLGDCASFWGDEIVINDEPTFKKLIQENKSGRCEKYKDVKIDFEKHTVLGANLFADCNASISLKVNKSLQEKWYELAVDEEYGGCRGMRVFSHFILVEKIPQDFSVRFKLNQRPRT